MHRDGLDGSGSDTILMRARRISTPSCRAPALDARTIATREIHGSGLGRGGGLGLITARFRTSRDHPATPYAPRVADDLDRLRTAAARGDQDAEDQLVELAGDRGDLAELRRLADAGSSDAQDVLDELSE